MSWGLPDDWDVQLDSLHEALRDPHTSSNTHALDIASVCQEIVNLTESSTWSDEMTRKQVRQSLLADFKLAITSANLGPNLGAELGDAARDLTRALNNAKSLEDSNDPAKTLLARMRSPSITAEAWSDLVTASATTSGGYRRYCGLRNTFLSLAALNAHELGSSSTAGWIQGVLTDNRFSISIARELIGVLDDYDSDPSQQRAGLPKLDRLDLCRNLWANVDREANNVVWLSYQYAPVHTHVLELGNVTIYDAAELVESIEDPNRRSIEITSDLTENHQELRSWYPPSENAQVLVRVDLGRSPIARAIENAIARVESIIEINAGRQRYG